MIQTIVPENEAEWLALRRQDVTSTEVAALFGCSPYMTEFELWHRKKGNVEVDFEPNERVVWGQRLQDSIAAGIAHDQSWSVRRMNEYMRDRDLRAGASFDFECVIHEDEGSPVQGERGILEIKNVDGLQFKDKWTVDGDNVEAPLHIELQVQQQLFISGTKFAYIGALIGGNRVVLIKREPDQKVIEQIRKKIGAFWDSIARNVEPSPNFGEDLDIIQRVYGIAEPGRVLKATEEISKLASRYKSVSEIARNATEQKDAAKAELLTLIGNAEKVIGDGFSISCGMQGPVMIPAFEKKGFRMFKINFKKEAKNG